MKRLIICCDGTWNRSDQERDEGPSPTNVVKLAYRVAKRDANGVPQVLFYDHGVGTGNTVDRFTGGAFGRGLEENIYDAYRFLVANYESGDEIFLFGFSRGAFTSRSIAGMIRKCGVLSRLSVDRYLAARELYRDAEIGPNDREAVDFRGKCSEDGEESPPIHCLGVWDTVGSLGVPVRGLRWLTRKKYQFHDVELSGSVKAAFHALAIDEHRAPFAPTLWAYKPKPEQTVEQVWFCGAHSDVGGGYAEKGLSDGALDWMLERVKAKTDLAFDQEVGKHYRIDPDPAGMLHNSKKRLYRLTPGIDRVIGCSPKDPADPEGEQQDDPTQSIHDSVRQRWNGDANYRPKPLEDYFARTGRVEGWDAV